MIGNSTSGYKPQRTESRELNRYLYTHIHSMDFPGGSRGKEPVCQCMRHKRSRFDPWVRKITLEEGMATYSRILGEYHGQRSLADYLVHGGQKKSDTTEAT